jgi:nucleotide-binding universal stress UspA family protein
MFRRILVPVDGSPASALGLKTAVRLAKDQRARLRLVHVVDEATAVGSTEAGIDVEAIIEALAKTGRAVLERARRAAAKAGVAPQTTIYESVAGTAADTILADARKWRADLIVMGTHGRRGIRRLVLGSDAEQVVRASTVPVLLVRGRRRG